MKNFTLIVFLNCLLIIVASNVLAFSLNSTIIANDDCVNVPIDTPVDILVVGNDEDPSCNIDPTTVTITDGPSNGTAVENGDGTVTYTPDPGYGGVDYFEYEICNDCSPLTCDLACVAIAVGASLVAANDDSATTPIDMSLTIPIIDNDESLTCGALDPSTITIISSPDNGTAYVNPNGSISYTPDPAYNGPDCLQYEICETLCAPFACDIACVHITVGPGTFPDCCSPIIPPLVYTGLLHEPVGLAEIAIINDILEVTNIGSSGNDGVDIHLGEAKGWGFTIDDAYPADQFPIGSFVEWTMKGIVDGVPDSPIFTERVEVADFNGARMWAVMLDKSSIGASQNIVRIYGENEELVYDEIVDNGLAFYIPTLEYVVQWDATCVVRPPIPDILLPNGTYINNATKIENFAFDAQALVSACTKVENKAAGVTSFTMKNESLAFFSPQLSFSVDAEETEMNAESTGLNITNISGANIEIDLGSVESVLLDYTIAGQQTGSSIHISAEGTVAGIPSQALGEVNINYDGQTYAISADYSSIGTSSYRLELYENDNVVAIVDNFSSNDIATTQMRPTGCGKSIPPFDPQLPCFILDHEYGPITLSNGDTYLADEIRILAENANDSPDNLSHFTIATVAIPSLKFEAAKIIQMQVSQPLEEGWNWTTSCLFSDEPPSLPDFFDGFPVLTGDIIKSQTQFSQYVDGVGWIGSLQNIGVGNTYLIKVAQEGDLILSGNLVQGPAAKVDFQPGWNWKTPNVTQVTPINNAFYPGTTFGNNDLIKTQTQFASYVGNGLDQWIGSLETLGPGDGTLVYIQDNNPPLNENSTAKKFGLPVDWVQPTGMEFNMTITGEVICDGVLDTDTDDYIAAFVDGDCRGVSKITSAGVKHLVFPLVASDVFTGETIIFHLYDASDDQVYIVDNTYTFTSNEIVGSYATPFQFLVTKLPLELNTFEAAPTRDKKVQLSWQTATETNTDYFGLEKSTDAEDWTTFGKVAAAGNSTEFKDYNSLDRFPFQGNNYYRLKQVDKDRTFSYSPVRVVNFEEERISQIFPNPIKGEATLYYELNENTRTAQLRISNTLGQQVKQFNLATNSNHFSLDVTDLPNGVYHYSLYVDGERVETFKLFVLN